MIKRALLSVSDKSGLAAFAKALSELGVELISTGGTAELLRREGLEATDISDVTGFPECLDGRVKTLDPHVHGGILARRDLPEHMDFIESLGIAPIDLIVVNLYPFKATIMQPDKSYAECVEQIDIGGPTMLRSGAKNHAAVTVVVDAADYEQVLAEIKTSGDTSLLTRKKLAQKVFAHTAAYDALVSDYLSAQLGQLDEVTAAEKEALRFPEKLTLSFEKVQSLRYGENGHQQASFYRDALPKTAAISEALQLQGKELSYNNISDTSAAMEALQGFSDPTVVCVKHANPCGVASAADIDSAWDLAYAADPVSVFGGIVALNREVTETAATKMAEIFLEVIIAPSYSEAAKAVFARKKNLRLLELSELNKAYPAGLLAYKAVYGGLLVQDADLDVYAEDEIKIVTKAQPTSAQLEDAYFGMQVVKMVKSNGIALVKNRQTIGIGPGQVNRVGAVEIAGKMAGEKAVGALLASDAFFPFDDCVRLAHEFGIRCIVQPGGSVRDQDSIAACDELGIAMIFTGKRHFRH